MSYFVNVRWGLSERPFLVVIPAKGELAYVSPGFEEQRAREIIKFSNDVRVWQEDEDWGTVVAGILKDRGVATGKVGVEERVRFFIAEGIAPRRRRAVRAGDAGDGGLPDVQVASRDRPDAARQRHHNRSVQGGVRRAHEGMTQCDFGGNVRAAFRRSARLADRPASSSASTPRSRTAASPRSN